MVYADPFAAGQAHARRHDDVDGIGRPGRVPDAKQVRGGRAGERGLRRQSKRDGPARQVMVGFKPGVGVYVVIESDPGVTAELSRGEHETVDGLASAEHLELELAGPVRRHGHGASMAPVSAA
jgi:hypothetical protein